jgi:hypothetical protein
VKQCAYFPQPNCEAWKQNNATTEMETTMNTREIWIFGMAAMGLVLTSQVQAAPNFMNGAFIVAARDQGEEVRPDQREDPRKNKRRASKRETEPEEPQGYGYGYERRQRERIELDRPDRDSGPRGRR